MRKAVFFVTVALFLFGCAFPDTIYREGASQDYVCLDAKPIALTSQNDEKDTLAPQVIKCASQTHIVGENGGIPFGDVPIIVEKGGAALLALSR
ncbi:MAG: hypothetical protein FJX48_12035 [Alphaproteobacteria bacterium]|nr:hypothetical protein [Alphaproteobacteria bacterium]